MKRLLVLLCTIMLLVVSCKKEKKFIEPEIVFARWSRAIANLNYPEYASCEAYPKSEGVFRTMFRNSYYGDLMVTEVGKLDEKKVLKDNNGNSYIKRNVRFECVEIRRRDRKPVRLLRGDVDFIKFTGGERAGQGWRMWNRQIIRIER
ncbi:MAG: hypothetical protein JW807_00395 [Spirochaetes bacterium]|nr:hypothetical protein [Spirochaetota bacterium]